MNKDIKDLIEIYYLDETLNDTLFKGNTGLIRLMRHRIKKLMTSHNNIEVSISDVSIHNIEELIGRPATGHILETFVVQLLENNKSQFGIIDSSQNKQTKSYDIYIDVAQLKQKNKNILSDTDSSKLDHIGIEVKAFKNGKIYNPKITKNQKAMITDHDYFLLIDYTPEANIIHINNMYLVNTSDASITRGNRFKYVNIDASLTDHLIYP